MPLGPDPPPPYRFANADMNVQKANEKSFFGKNMTFKKLFQ